MGRIPFVCRMLMQEASVAGPLIMISIGVRPRGGHQYKSIQLKTLESELKEEQEPSSCKSTTLVEPLGSRRPQMQQLVLRIRSKALEANDQNFGTHGISGAMIP